MSREIKFRAWDIFQNRMHYGVESGIYEDPDEIISFDRILGLACYEVMQCTGLKDKNEKEIYEGDIIDASYVNPMSNEVIKKHYLIEYGEGQYKGKLIGSSPYGDTWINFINEKGRVISNIYENPELLESEVYQK